MARQLRQWNVGGWRSLGAPPPPTGAEGGATLAPNADDEAVLYKRHGVTTLIGTVETNATLSLPLDPGVAVERDAHGHQKSAKPKAQPQGDRDFGAARRRGARSRIRRRSGNRHWIAPFVPLPALSGGTANIQLKAEKTGVTQRMQSGES